MTVTVKMLVDRLKLKVVYGNKELLAKPITTADISRPGLEMTGYFDYYSPERLQLVGMKEWSYLKTMTENNRYSVFTNMFKEETPAVIVARGLNIPEEMLRAAKENGVAVLQGRYGTSSLSGDMSWYLNSQLAERTSVHGVLVDIYGMGVLIQGDSGIGKSETALELIKRGHRLVADDAVEIKRINRTTLMGSAPEMIRYYMELRGIGVIDARQIYGVGAVKPESRVDLVVQLEPWEDGRAYDRLGLTTEYCEILNVRVPCVTIPVGPGRNLAVILELAAMNNRQKGMGYNAAQKLAAEHDRGIDLGIGF